MTDEQFLRNQREMFTDRKMQALMDSAAEMGAAAAGAGEPGMGAGEMDMDMGAGGMDMDMEGGEEMPAEEPGAAPEAPTEEEGPLLAAPPGQVNYLVSEMALRKG